MFIGKKLPPVFVCSTRARQRMGSVELVLTGSSFCWGPSTTPRLSSAPSPTYQDVTEHNSRVHGEGISSSGETACGKPRVTVIANSVENYFPVTRTDINLGCFSTWHKSKLLTHIHMPNLLQSPKLMLIKLPYNKFSSSVAPMLHPNPDSPTTARMPHPAERMGKLGLK